jgi:tRNA dimethylallyltransferase
MDIGTAKLPLSQRRGVPHHQIDVLTVREEASVAAYQRHARADLQAIAAAGRTPLVVGGSGLYVSGLLDRLDFPGRDPAVREQLEDLYAREGAAPLLAELAEKDPRAHRAIHHGNVRRVIRALEVVRLTGGPYTPRFPRHTSFYPNVSVFATTRRTDLLDQAIRARAERMVDDGLIEETRALLDRGLAQGPTAPRATGYSQAIAVIEGRLDRREAAQAIAQATRRLAKKQTTWFTADPRVRWIDLSDGDVCGAATRILDTVGP